MSHSYLDSFLFSCLPAVFLLIGAVIASLFTPNKVVKSVVQHFASGVVFAAVAVELIPLMLTGEANWTIVFGFIIGVFLVLGLHSLAHRVKKSKWRSKIPYSMTAAIGIDLFLDGLLIGVAFIAGETAVALIAISLSACAFFLAFALMGKLKKVNLLPKWGLMLALAILLPLGAMVGQTLIITLPVTWYYEILAFGIAALLYLALEELFIDAHEEIHGGWICSAFFLGFLAILLLRIH
ncbi:MAG: hypothetical protein K940chlam2_00201 [Chlamydiae bacterium]|nr:hypothetical protein [Chlamydiota bacterium]